MMITAVFLSHNIATQTNLSQICLLSPDHGDDGGAQLLTDGGGGQATNAQLLNPADVVRGQVSKLP
jgi:hypothetical protein